MFNKAMTRQRSKYIKIITDGKPMKAIRQKLPVLFDLNQVIRFLYLPPSRAELMKAYQKGWDDRKAYEVANSRVLKGVFSPDLVIFQLNDNPKYYNTHPNNDPKSIIHKRKKSWKENK